MWTKNRRHVLCFGYCFVGVRTIWDLGTLVVPRQKLHSWGLGANPRLGNNKYHLLQARQLSESPFPNVPMDPLLIIYTNSLHDHSHSSVSQQVAADNFSKQGLGLKVDWTLQVFRHRTFWGRSDFVC
jgi:hypothetical protein